MPRRRATKIHVRETPKGSSKTDPNKLSKEETKAKMEVFLSDFDVKVANQLKAIEDEKKRMLQVVSRRIHLQIMQLPWDVRHMTLREFVAAGGTLEAVSEKQIPVDDVKDSAVFKSRGKYCETIAEERDFAVPKAAAGKKKMNGTKTYTLRSQEPMSSVKSSFKTPMANHMAAGWDTPLITPKFDPRLPFQCRDPKPGERLVSIQGSPVAVAPKKGPSISVKNNHLTMDLDLGENLDDVEVDLNEDYIKKVMAMFSQISNKLAIKH